jgi:hypothetical protein
MLISVLGQDQRGRTNEPGGTLGRVIIVSTRGSEFYHVRASMVVAVKYIADATEG